MANSFIISFAFMTGFLVAKTFVDLVQSIGLAYTFWMYGAICLLGNYQKRVALFPTLFAPRKAYNCSNEPNIDLLDIS